MARLVKLALHLKRRYSSRIRDDVTLRAEYFKNGFRRKVFKEVRRGESRGCLPLPIENIGVRLKVSSGPPSGGDRIKEVICESGCRI